MSDTITISFDLDQAKRFHRPGAHMPSVGGNVLAEARKRATDQARAAGCKVDLDAYDARWTQGHTVLLISFPVT